MEEIDEHLEDNLSSQRGDSDYSFHLSHSLNDERWKYYNSNNLNMNIELPKAVVNVVTTLVENVSIRQAVAMIICNLLAIEGEFTVAYSRDRVTKPRTYNKRNITYVKLLKAVDWLVQNGYALEQRGKKSDIVELRFSSYLWPTSKLLNLFKPEQRKQSRDSYIATGNYVVLKDKNKSEVDYKQTKEVVQMKLDMEEINKHNSQFLFTDNKEKQLNCSSLTRIFTEDFKFGGRIYRTDVHQIKHNGVNALDSRLGITINRKPVVEVDFANLHAMMLCAMEGIDTRNYHGDIYDYILRCTDIEFKTQDRKLIKQAFNIMLNSASSGKAMQAIQGLINAQPHTQERYTIRSGAIVWQMIYDNMEEFQKYFDNPDNTGLQLQRMDSDIAILVCKHFVAENKPIIPVHDSFIVWDEDCDLLLHTMVAAFKQVLTAPKEIPIYFRVESAYYPTENIAMY